MNKSNCEEIEEVSNNILTGEKFDEMIEKYKDNPLLRFFRGNNRRHGYCEISLIGMWIKTLQDSKIEKEMEDELYNIKMNLVNAAEKYQHARLQLKIAATIHRNNNSDMVLLELEPGIKPEHLKDPKRLRKPDILADIKGEKVYIEIVTKNETKRYGKYQNITMLITEMAKLIDPNKKVYTELYNLQMIPSTDEIDEALRDVASRFKKGVFSFCAPKKNFTIAVKEGRNPIGFSIEEIEYENGVSRPVGYSNMSARAIYNTIKVKSAQLPKNSPGFIVTDLTGISLTGPSGGYTKKGIQQWFDRYVYRSDILGIAFMSNHADFNTRGCAEEPHFRFFENDNHDCGINSEDVVNALTGSWHADFTCLKRYRDLFDNFYNKVPILRYVHWQDKLINEAKKILRDV